AKTLLSSSNLFVRSHAGSGANVRAVAETIALFPYDLLIIATPCGEVAGERQIYAYTDSDGIARKLAVDVASGFVRTEHGDEARRLFHVVSLDGVDWHDPEKAEKLHVGCALADFHARTRAGAQHQLAPVSSETIRITASAALKMYDQNFVPLPMPMADHGTPIIINNAFGSWHRLAEIFTAAGARAYVAPLFPVSADAAQGMV